MQVNIKEFKIDMEVKNKGIEFGVRERKDDPHAGDCIVNKKGLTWGKGKTSKNAVSITWREFMQIMASNKAKKAAIEAAKKETTE